MNDKVEIEIKQEYVELLGDHFLDERSKPTSNLVSDFIEDIHDQVISTSVINEFKSGWRSKVTVESYEQACSKFVKACVRRYESEDMDIKVVRKLIQPIQIPTAKKYRQEHIDALKNAPMKYRKRHANALSPLIEACSDSLDVRDILGLLVDGLFESMHSWNRHNKPKSVVKNLCAEIEELGEDDKIDLSDEYFYQGPRHLGVIEANNERIIASCVCEYTCGFIFPLFIAPEDPVNSEAIPILEDIADD